MEIEALEKAVRLAGGQSALARLIGKKQSHVWTWINRGCRAPADQVIPISRAVDLAVTPYELRPDIYPDPEWLPPDLAPDQKCAADDGPNDGVGEAA